MTTRVFTPDQLQPVTDVRITRWRGGQNPTPTTITRLMEQEGLRPYAFVLTPNYRDGVKSHGYGKVLYCVEGSVDINLPDLNQRVTLKPGDRLELPRGTRHSVQVGSLGARMIEGNLRSSGIRQPLN